MEDADFFSVKVFRLDPVDDNFIFDFINMSFDKSRGEGLDDKELDLVTVAVASLGDFLVSEDSFVFIFLEDEVKQSGDSDFDLQEVNVGAEDSILLDGRRIFVEHFEELVDLGGVEGKDQVVNPLVLGLGEQFEEVFFDQFGEVEHFLTD